MTRLRQMFGGKTVKLQEITGIQEIIERLMQEKDSFYDKEELRATLDDVVIKIKNKISGDNYIYRGEPQRYKHVSSNLYRQRYHKDNLDLFKHTIKEIDLPFIEDTLVDIAQRHYKADKNKTLIREKVLDDIQHWGGETNRIDFTKRLEVALFFACFGNYDKDGRIILKKKKSVRKKLRTPKSPVKRVKAQQSVFVIEPSGIVESDDEIVIPSRFKHIILKCLNRLSPPISIYTMYGDIFGFVKFCKKYRNVYFKYISAFSLARAGVLERDFVGQDKIKASIGIYKMLIEEMPFISDLYSKCGVAHASLQETDHAIDYFKKALAWKPDDYESWKCLGMAYLDKIYPDRIKFANEALACFNKIPEEHGTRDFGYYLHRGKAHIDLKNYKLAAEDLDKTLQIIQQEKNKKIESNAPILKKSECSALYFLGQTLLCLDKNTPIWKLEETESIKKTLTLNKFNQALKFLTKAKSFNSNIYNNIKGPCISREEFKKMGIQLPDEIAKLLLY